jgi:hypothetical protein
MPRNRTLYTTADLELLKSNLAGVLTKTVDHVSALVRDKYMEEVIKLAEVFKSMPNVLHHKWQAAVLAKLPIEALKKRESGEYYVDPDSEATMRFLSGNCLDTLPEKGQKVILARQQLFEKLFDSMNTQHKKIYREMFTWVPAECVNEINSEYFPLDSDTSFGRRLYLLESLMDQIIMRLESTWKVSKGWPEGESVPFDVTRKCSHEALEHLSEQIHQWYEEIEEQDNVPDSLLALTSANLSVNRVLLEFAAIDARGMEASEMVIEFLCELNRIGITEVPVEIEGYGRHEACIKLHELLTSLFGHRGVAPQQSDYFKRRMNKSDIDVVIGWSQQLQDKYIFGRGHRGGKAVHGSSNHLFIFALTLVAAFYCNTRTGYEFKGKSNSTYAVFPDRKTHAQSDIQIIPAHAEQILLQAYGQVYFANSGWDLKAERVRQYAETTSIKRSHLQQLILFASKWRSSSQLSVLYYKLSSLTAG